MIAPRASARAASAPPRAETLLRHVVGTHGAWVECGGASMHPTLRVGDRMRVVEASSFQAGDVVLYASGNGLVVHRVVLRVPTWSGAWIVHAGDAAPGSPGLIDETAIIGRVLTPRRCHSFALRARIVATLVRQWSGLSLRRRDPQRL